MAAAENIKRINKKVEITLAIFIFISIIISVTFAFYDYSTKKITPEYKDNILDNKKIDVDNRCHIKYFKTFIVNKTVSLILKNLLFITLIFFIICYSHVITKSDLITSDTQGIDFSQIVSLGLYILIALTALYIISQEIFIPTVDNKLEWVKNNTTRAVISLNNGNEAYNNKNYQNALLLYEDYLSIIEEDDEVEDRIRELKNTLMMGEYEEIKEKSNITASHEQSDIGDTLHDYNKLADYYFENKDYQTAWYYYQQIAESGSTRKNEALTKIETIKKIFRYEKSLMSKNSKPDDIEKLLDKTSIGIHDIYVMKNKAEDFFNAKDYLQAYFVYEDILKINPSLRDIAESQSNSFNSLNRIAADKSVLDRAKIYPGKDNFVFMLSQNTLLFIGRITSGYSKHYLYDVKIYSFDDNFNVKSIIKAPYGETKSPSTFTLYSYSLTDRNNYSYPIVSYSNGKEEILNEYIFELPQSTTMSTLYNFTYDYKKTLSFSLFKLFQLKKLISSESSNKFSIGFNNNFIKTAIADKVSRVFLFFSLNLIFISLAWRFRTTYFTGIPFVHLILILVIPVFIYFTINILLTFITSFYSILSVVTSFASILIISFVINIFIMLSSIIFIASSK